MVCREFGFQHLPHMLQPALPILFIRRRRRSSLRKSQEVIGLSIIHRYTGKQLGTVSDVLFDSANVWQGILLEQGGLFKRHKFIPAKRLCSVGMDAVVVESEADIQDLPKEAESWIGLCSGEKKLKGRTIMLSNGRELGMVENVYFQEEVGTLVGYEVSEGLLADLRQGRKVLRCAQPLVWGEDVLIAPLDGIRIKES
ncbi:photosystem reaction center subunit H [Laceyella tengchongensis]|nr:photosystem reaction center subunit H [Laceyella tengchongensis]